MTYSGFYRRSFLIATVAILAYLLLAVLAPLKGALGWAVVLAFLLHPLHERLSRRLKGRSMLSAGIITGLTPFLVLAPLSVLGMVFAGQVGNLIGYLRGQSFAYPQLLARLQSYPLLGKLLRWWSTNFPVTATQIQGWITGEMQSVLKSAATVGGGLALGLFGTVVGFFMMLFLLFFLLRDGRAILDHVKRLIPLESARRERLLDYLGRSPARWYSDRPRPRSSRVSSSAWVLRSPGCRRRSSSAYWRPSRPCCLPGRASCWCRR